MVAAHSAYTAPFSVHLAGHAAIVTGGGTGIGRAAALALAAAGAAVMIGDVNPLTADETVAAITEAGGRAAAFQTDVANRFQVSALIETARDQFGRVDILVNAAGVRKLGALSALDEWDWRRVLDVNLTGAFFTTQLLGRVMADEGGGVIVNIASTAGHTATLPDGVSYVASKAGLIGLTRQSARELAPVNVRVNAICPANTLAHDARAGDTPRNMQNRLADPDEIAQVALFLCSDSARFITGQAINVDGGAIDS